MPRSIPRAAPISVLHAVLSSSPVCAMRFRFTLQILSSQSAAQHTRRRLGRLVAVAAGSAAPAPAGMNEDTEVLRVTLRNADNAQLAGGGATLSAAGRIEDEDPLPGLSLGNGSLTEGAGGGSMRFEVRLKPASGRTVTVQYGTADVTATGGSDYTPVSGTLYAAARRCCASTARPAPPDGGPSGCLSRSSGAQNRRFCPQPPPIPATAPHSCGGPAPRLAPRRRALLLSRSAHRAPLHLVPSAADRPPAAGRPGGWPGAVQPRVVVLCPSPHAPRSRIGCAAGAADVAPHSGLLPRRSNCAGRRLASGPAGHTSQHREPGVHLRCRDREARRPSLYPFRE